MNGWLAMFLHKRLSIGLACTLALLSGGNVVLAEDRPTEAQMLEALRAHGPTRAALNDPADDQKRSDERRFVEALRRKKPRTITIDDRRRVAEITRQKPSIDLEVTFAHGSATIDPQAVPVLVALGRTLGDSDLKGATFVIAGHTDAAGSDSYNQLLSERRAEAVKIFLTRQFKLSPDRLLAVGFGRSQLKNAANPLAPENRRVQIVNVEQKTTVSQK